MTLDLTLERLEACLGRRVEVFAFGTTYIGILKEISKEDGKIKVVDSGDFVIIEIERIHDFKCLEK